MKPLVTMLLLCGLAHANDALDVLEGKKNAADIPLPPAPEGSAAAADERVPVVYIDPGWEPGPLDPLWAKAVLFDDAANPWIQHVAMTGYFNGQAAFGKATVDKVEDTPSKKVNLDGSRTTRARLGARLRAFRNTDIEATAEFAGDSSFRGIDRLSARTSITPEDSVTYGKFRPTFTTEHATEDASQPYPDRSMLVNMIAPRSTLGFLYQHQGATWDYGFGWFSRDGNPDLPAIEGEGLLAFNLSRTFVEPSGKSVMRTRWHLDYIHNLDGSASGTIPSYDIAGGFSANGDQLVTNNPSFRHLFATGVRIDRDDFSFTGEFMLAKGDTTVWGMSLGPSYWLVPGTLNLVGRYQYAGSDDAGALVSTMGASSDPAFDDSPFFIGNEYNSIYLGANLHLYQDQLILMGGYESISFKDDAGGGFNTDASLWHTGIKASF
jgi:hypothetical protein